MFTLENQWVFLFIITDHRLCLIYSILSDLRSILIPLKFHPSIDKNLPIAAHNLPIPLSIIPFSAMVYERYRFFSYQFFFQSCYLLKVFVKHITFLVGSSVLMHRILFRWALWLHNSLLQLSLFLFSSLCLAF